MLHSVSRRLDHLEDLIPPRFTYSRFATRACEHARRCGVSPGMALVTVIEDLSEREIDRLLEELGGQLEVRSEMEAQEAIRSGAIKVGFSPDDVELLARYSGNACDEHLKDKP